MDITIGLAIPYDTTVRTNVNRRKREDTALSTQEFLRKKLPKQPKDAKKLRGLYRLHEVGSRK